MIHNINKNILIEELTALKARKMSLSAGIIPDHNTNWKGALKKVRGQNGELTTGKELSDIKQKIGFPENNVLQKLKSAENMVPNGNEVGYGQKTKNIINGQFRSLSISGDDSSVTNKNQVGFIHTHPYMDKQSVKKYGKDIIDRPSGLTDNMAYNKRFSAKDFILSDSNDIKTYYLNPETKFPIYAPSENTVSVSRVFSKQPNPVYTLSDIKTKQNYDDNNNSVWRKIDLLSKSREKTNDKIKLDYYRRKISDLLEAKPEKPKLYKDNKFKINHTRFIVGKDNYDNFNLNGEKIKG